MGIRTALWEKWIEFRDAWLRITLSAVISPLLYLIAFGYGLGGHTGADGHPYIAFLIPGVIALSSMNTGYSAVATPLNVQRLYEHSFEQILISPTPLWQFVLGQVIGGSLRGLYAGCIIVLMVAPIPTGLVYNGLYFLIMFLNGAVFSAIAVVVSFYAKTHTDVPRFSNYVIMPMSYLCNTFFSTENMPDGLRQVVGALPLSQASAMLRSISGGGSVSFSGVAILFLYFAVFLTVAFIFLYRKKNL